MRGGGGRSRPGRCLGGEGGRGGRDLPVGFCRSPIGCDAFGGEGGRARVRSYRGGGAVGGGICRLVFVGAHLGAMGWRGRRSRPSALLQGGGAVGGRDLPVGFRSEEHTSELQSLMRISYAVFCLEKKN